MSIPASVKNILNNAFYDGKALSDVYYSGTKAQWEQINIENSLKGNNSLLNAAIHYNAAPCSDTSENCTVTFNPNGGTTTTKSKNVTNDSTYGTLPTPTRSGYRFDGWYTSKTDGTKITSATKVTKTVNYMLYAHWSKRNFTVNLNANGGTLLTDSVTATLGARYRHLPTPTRASYHFDGWYTAKFGGTKITESMQVKSGVTTASVAKTAAAQSGEYVIACTKMVKLSNGTVRYYGIFPKVSKTTSYWFTYTDEIYID